MDSPSSPGITGCSLPPSVGLQEQSATMPTRKVRPNVGVARTIVASTTKATTSSAVFQRSDKLNETPNEHVTTPILNVNSTASTNSGSTSTPSVNIEAGLGPGPVDNNSISPVRTNDRLTGTQDITRPSPLQTPSRAGGTPAASKASWTRKKVAPKMPPPGKPRKRKEPSSSNDQSKHPKLADDLNQSPNEDTTLLDSTNTMDTDIEGCVAPPIEPHSLCTQSSLSIASNIEVSLTTPLDDITTNDSIQHIPSQTVNDIHPTDCTIYPPIQEQANGPANDIHDHCSNGNDIHDDTVTIATSDSTISDSRSVSSESVTSSNPSLTDDPSQEEPNKRKRKKSSNESSSSTKRSKKSSSHEPRRSKGGKSSQFKEAPDRSKMTMQDLIYYNPSANPMSSTDKFKNTNSGTGNEQETNNNGNNMDDITNKGKDDADCDNDEGIVVPKLKMDVHGNIVIDEQSMVVESTRVSQVDVNDIVIEDGDYITSTSFRNKSKIKKWTKEETNEFYKALSQVGTDFTMMTLILSKRTRTELKNKFKKEEKSNPGRVSKVLDKVCAPNRATPTLAT